MILVALIIVLSLTFDFINGFHDTANAIATVVSTRVLTPRAAIVMSAGLNFLGALFFTNVAATISKGLITYGGQTVILAAIAGAITWNLITWYFGIPSSSSHALVGGLVGAAMVRGGAHAVLWQGVIHKVVIPLVASPLVGFAIGFVLMAAIIVCLSHANAVRTGHMFRMMQILSSATMSFAHGSNDAQKSMGIITLAIVSYSGGSVAKAQIPLWVKLACAIAMALGTSFGGWRIIKTMGHKILRLEPVHGFAAEVSAAAVILTATVSGMAVSTTHVISGSIFGVGCARRMSAVRWQVAQNMVVAWVLTIPAAGAVAGCAYLLLAALRVH